LNVITPLLPEGKNSRLNHEWENTCLPFIGQQRQHSPGVHGERYENQLQDLNVDPVVIDIISQSHLSGKKPLHCQNDSAKPHTSVATSVVIENIGFKVTSHPP
jgi:hypothetical protein